LFLLPLICGPRPASAKCLNISLHPKRHAEPFFLCPSGFYQYRGIVKLMVPLISGGAARILNFIAYGSDFVVESIVKK
jgi:hypothetical protein